MNKNYTKILLIIMIISFKCALWGIDAVKVSELGKYSGYTESIYKEWIRTSQYVKMKDGTCLAVDIFRPSINGKPVDAPMPVIWSHTRYKRSFDFMWFRNDYVHVFPWLQTIIKHGYVVAVVDARGSGASFGIRRFELPPEEAEDAYEMTEWLASQKWCDGKVGMFGRSYLGLTQYLAAAKKPPHLKAIFPEMAQLDIYSPYHLGGVFKDKLAYIWSQFNHYNDTVAYNFPVDEDKDGKLAVMAKKQHISNCDFGNGIKELPYRDSIMQGLKPYIDLSPSTYLKDINESGVAVYHLEGWLDGYPNDGFYAFNNLTNPKKIIIGPWYHMSTSQFDIAAEHLRWYDYWLKGIDNGIMKEPPIHYYVMGASEGIEWRTAWKWPLPDVKMVKYYFKEGTTKTINSINDSYLDMLLPDNDAGQDDYTIDYTATTGQNSRWYNLFGSDFNYPDMSGNDRKGLTYTTAVLNEDMEITGNPLAHLCITSTVTDCDFFVYLENIDGNGRSQYVTEGVLKASHRTISNAPYSNFGLPYHRSFREDIQELPLNEPIEMVIDLLPTSIIFKKGNRIRVTITCVDKDNAEVVIAKQTPRISVLRNKNNSSYIELPIIPIKNE